MIFLSSLSAQIHTFINIWDRDDGHLLWLTDQKSLHKNLVMGIQYVAILKMDRSHVTGTLKVLELSKKTMTR